MASAGFDAPRLRTDLSCALNGFDAPSCILVETSPGRRETCRGGAGAGDGAGYERAVAHEYIMWCFSLDGCRSPRADLLVRPEHGAFVVPVPFSRRDWIKTISAASVGALVLASPDSTMLVPSMRAIIAVAKLRAGLT